MHRYFEINESGHNIRCKLYYSDLKNIRRIVLFCHGFGGHKDNGAAERFSERLLAKHKGVAFVTFNLPCHGDDVKKKLTLSDCLTYLELVVGYLRQRYETDELYCYATSFGGYLTLLYLAQQGNPFRKIVLRCPAVNMYDVITSTIITPADLETLARGREVPVGFDRKVPVSPAFLEDLRTRDVREIDYLDFAEDILILHGTADEIVPFSAAAEFADNQLMEFIPIEGADHRFRDPRRMDAAIKHILEFFAL